MQLTLPPSSYPSHGIAALSYAIERLDMAQTLLHSGPSARLGAVLGGADEMFQQGVTVLQANHRGAPELLAAMRAAMTDSARAARAFTGPGVPSPDPSLEGAIAGWRQVALDAIAALQPTR